MTFRSETTRHTCQKCGHTEDTWFARCRACREWSAPVTPAKPVVPPASSPRPDDLALARAARVTSAPQGPVLVADVMPVVHEVPVPITSVSEDKCKPLPCGIEPLDRVLGGGFMPASGVIIGGEPGSGKSTLLAQALAGLGLPVMYATAEETVGQVAARAKRVNAAHDRIMLIREPNVDRILMHAKRLRELGPLVLLVDSINTLYTEDIDSAPNSLAQVRECAARVCAFGKNFDVIHIIVAQVNKEGNIAGPKTVEHLVDVVLSLELGAESEGLQHIRFLHAHKNRHGNSMEVGAFEMKEEGMVSCGVEARETAADRDAVYLPLAQELLTRYRALGGTFEGGLRERIGDLLDLDAQMSRGPQVGPRKPDIHTASNVDELLGITKNDNEGQR